MSGGIDDEKTRNLVLLLAILEDSQQVVSSCDATKKLYLVHDSSLGLDSIHREVRSTNLLSDTTGFAFLNVGLPNLNPSKSRSTP